MDAGVRSRATRAALACGVAAVAGLASAGAASAATVNVGPSDPGIDSAAAWSATASRSCGLLCAAGGTRVTSGGNPGSYLHTEFDQLVSLLADGTVTWRSSTFTWNGASPAGATLSIDRRADLGPLLSVNGSLGWTVDLVDVTNSTRTPIINQTLGADHPTFETVTKAAQASALVNGHTYRIESKVALNALASVLGSETLDIDNVSLTAQTDPLPTINGSPTATGGRRGATLSADVSRNGGSDTAHVEYGPTTAYGAQTAPVTVSADGTISLPVTGLSPATTYHARLVLVNGDGARTEGADVIVTTAALQAPGLTAAASSSVTSEGATIGATLDPQGLSTQYRVEYGPTTAYGSTTAWQTLSPGAGATDVAVALSGLDPATTYHARIVARSEDGDSAGGDVTFTTQATPAGGGIPAVTTAQVAGVGDHGASFVATLDDNGLDTDYYVEYGPTAAFGQQTATQSQVADLGPTGISATLSGLQGDTDYYARLVAVNASGRVASSTVRFHTDPDLSATQQPLVTGGALGSVSTTGASVSASIDPSGLATTVRAQYGPTTAYGLETTAQTLPATAGPTQVVVPVTGLTPDSDYHVRVVATNADGTTTTSDIAVHTSPVPGTVTQPALSGGAAAATSATAATFGATIDDGGANTTYHVAYGTTPAMTQATADVVLPAGSGPTPVSVDLTGLAPETTYYAQLVATNSAGTSQTAQVSVTTDPAPVVNQPATITGSQTSGLSADGVTVWATIDPNDTATQYRVAYGPSAAYGQATDWHTLAAGAGPTAVSVLVSGLSPSTGYHLRLETQNAGGSTNGSDLSISTQAAPVTGTTPSASAPASQAVTDGSAHVSAAVDNGGLDTDYYVEYGPTGAFGSTTPTQTIPASATGSQPIDVTMSGLTADTQYFARVVTVNGHGRRDSSVITFRTAAAPSNSGGGGSSGGGGNGGSGGGGTTSGGGGGGDTTTTTTIGTGTTAGTGTATPTGGSPGAGAGDGTLAAAGTAATPATVSASRLTLRVRATAHRQTLAVRSNAPFTATTVRLPQAAKVTARVKGAKLGTLRAGGHSWRLVANGRTIDVRGAKGAPKVTVMRAGGLRVTRLAQGTRTVTIVLNRRSTKAVRRQLATGVRASARQGGRTVVATRVANGR